MTNNRNLSKAKRFPLLVAAVAISTLTVLLLAGLGFLDRGPIYKGRSLRAWLELYHYSTGNALPGDSNRATPQSVQAASAVRQIGTNALRWLLKWTPCEIDEPLTLRLGRTLLHGVPADVLGKTLSRSTLNSRLAVDGFRILGPIGSPAIPQLVELMQNTNAPRTADRCKAMLAFTGEPGLVPLLNLITNRQGFQRESAVGALLISASLTNLVPAVPVLGGWLRDKQLASDAQRVLLQAGLCCPEVALCILTNDDCAANRAVRLQAIKGIGDTRYPWGHPSPMWSNAAAIPYLVQWLGDPDPAIRRESFKALHMIAPEMLDQVN